MVLNLLSKAKEKNKLVGLRTINMDFEESIIGFVHHLDNEKVIIREIDQYGEKEGLTTIDLKKIINIDFDDRYQKRLLCVYNSTHSLNAEKKILIYGEKNELVKAINSCINDKTIVKFLFTKKNYATGIPISVDSSSVLIKSIGWEGDDDGLSLYSFSEIIGLQYDSIDEQIISLLYSNKKSFYDF
jgi:hypothetical protein